MKFRSKVQKFFFLLKKPNPRIQKQTISTQIHKSFDRIPGTNHTDCNKINQKAKHFDPNPIYQNIVRKIDQKKVRKRIERFLETYLTRFLEREHA